MPKIFDYNYAMACMSSVGQMNECMSMYFWNYSLHDALLAEIPAVLES